LIIGKCGGLVRTAAENRREFAYESASRERM
jgi:hypothetical protein